MECGGHWDEKKLIGNGQPGIARIEHYCSLQSSRGKNIFKPDLERLPLTVVLKARLLVLYFRIIQGLLLAPPQISRMRISGVEPIICMLTKLPCDCMKRAPIPHFDAASSINRSPQLSTLSGIWPSLYHLKVRRPRP